MNLKGGVNFRCLGGYRSDCGRTVKSGILYRSGTLSRLTKEDLELLGRSEISFILDYRDEQESAKDQDQVWQGVRYELWPANPKDESSSAAVGDFFSNDHLEALPEDFMEVLYKKLPFDNKAYQRLFEEMRKGEGIVQHCAVGKDRTGVGSALLLLSLGVSEDQVISDYLITEKTLAPYREHVFKELGSGWSARAQEVFRTMMSANADWLEASFQEIKKKYQNWDSYFVSEYSLDMEQRESLKGVYLE